ncbi:unnamed protein product [Amoebophrya sp. A25]|nr:unnamed protein product [Amoebophrya sp. A25]|eukprot:GSA25T00018382001.1
MEGQRWDTAQDVDDYVLEKTMMKILQEENDDKGALPSQSSNTKAPPRGGGWAWQVYAYIALMFFTFFWVVDLSAGGFVFTAVSSLVSTPNQAPAHDSSGRQGGVKTGQEPSLRGFGAKLYQQASTSSKFILPKEGKGQSSFLATSNAPGCKGVLGCGAESPPKSSDAASSSFFALAVGTDPWEHAAVNFLSCQPLRVIGILTRAKGSADRGCLLCLIS